mmetsp:Transcript_37439/g.82116  ORF Transcript_37439/g.82116 Transcript_37439/m.82116 type:complete len:476 (+) Transcript_37439:57-1484(+)
MAAETEDPGGAGAPILAGSLAAQERGPVLRRGSSRFIKGSSERKPPNVDGTGFMAHLRHPLSALLLCLPLGIAAHYLEWGNLTVFWMNFFAMVPLAKILGDATEELAAGLHNDMVAGLLNATFGNAVEIVITVQTLRAGLFSVVKATLLGSVLSNLLLVLGMSFFFGGIVSSVVPGKKPQLLAASSSMVDGRRSSLVAGSMSNIPSRIPEIEQNHSGLVTEKVQTFSTMNALVNTSMLLLSCLSFTLVTIFYETTHFDGRHEMEEVLLPVSRICSVIIMVAYCAYIVFQLVTHREAMSEGEEEGGEEGEQPTMSISGSILVMFLTTIVISFSSEMLVDTISDLTEQAHISQQFIGIVLLPIVGNACEHAAAVRFAIQDKPGLSIGIAVGSSTQIALFVVPFSVLAGWFLGLAMDLNFGAMNTAVMNLSVIVVLSVVVDGQANWLQGYLLMSAYCVIAVLFWFVPNDLPPLIPKEL